MNATCPRCLSSMFKPMFVPADKRTGCEFCAEQDIVRFQSATPRHVAIRTVPLARQDALDLQVREAYGNVTHGG